MFWARAFALLMAIAVIFAMLFVFLFSAGCPGPTRYPGNYLNVAATAPPKKEEAKPTPNGVLFIVKKAQKSFAELGKVVDAKTAELETCLKDNGVITKPIRRDWFGVYIPKGWYVSKCSKQQMIPSRVNYKLCEQKKLNGKHIKIEEECRQHTHPTELCPCPCNVRSAIHDNFWIVTTPDFRLFKAELARLVTGQNNPWINKKISVCLK